MSMTDPIADMLTRIRNGAMANHETVDMPWSRLKEAIAKVLVEEGYVRQFRRVQVEGRVQDTLRIHLKYDRNNRPVISELKRVSRPGRRVYLGYKDIHPVRKGLGTHILSTPRGIVVDREAVKAKVGGELLCSVS